MFAVIQTGGKQYRVAPGDVIYIEKINAQEEDKVSFEALLLSNDEGVKIGTPTVPGVSVEGLVKKHGKGQKVLVYKYKSKKNYRRKRGHRQPFTRVEITAIAGA